MNLNLKNSNSDKIAISNIMDDKQVDLLEKIERANLFLFEGEYNLAFEIVKEIIDNNPDSKEAYYAVYIIAELMAKAPYLQIENYIESKTNNSLRKNIYGRLDLLIKSHDKLELEQKYDQLQTKYSDFPVLEDVLYRNLLYSVHEKKDIPDAEKFLTQLKNKFPSSALIENAVLHMNLLHSDYKFSPDKQEQLGENSSSSLEEELLGNYPNPFNPSTIIKYQVPETGTVKIKIYDILGKEITTLVNETQMAGLHEVEFNAEHLPSGVYIYTINANGIAQSRKMILTK